jgi:methyl-accepting chemotaxis protein
MTDTNMENVVRRRDVDLVIELTGSTKVRQIIQGMLRDNQEFMAAGSARAMCQLIDTQSARNAQAVEQVSVQFQSLAERLGRSSNSIQQAFTQNEGVLNETRLVTMNGRIQAARVGKVGDAFQVVVGRMQEMVAKIHEAQLSIGDIAKENESIIKELELARRRLLEIFGKDKEVESQ